MNTFTALCGMAMLPVIMSIVLYAAVKINRKDLREYMRFQILTGLIFGAIAVCGTEFGISYEGAVINARDAAPLCAGLIFGKEAGIIAGLIGGIERYLSPLWGGGEYTRFACTVSTVFAGWIAGRLRTTMFDNRRPHWVQALFVAGVMEIIHMLMIFITNLSDVRRAFNYVTVCTIPMVSSVAASVALAVFAINLISRRAHDAGPLQAAISIKFQKRLSLVVGAFFIATSAFSYLLQNEIYTENTKDLLRQSLDDVVRDVQDQCDEALLHVNRLVVSELTQNPDADLSLLMQRYNVCEINIVARNAIVTASTDRTNVGFNMAEGGMQSASFLCLLRSRGPEEFVQGYMPQSKDNSEWRKYSGVRMGEGFVQTAYNGSQLTDEISSLLYNVVSNRHIGESGFMVVLDSGSQIVSTTENSIAEAYDGSMQIELDPDGTEEYTVYVCRILTTKYYYMFTTSESYSVVGLIPVEEADYSKILSTYLIVFSQAVIFGVLFYFIYMILKHLVVNNIQSINASLAKITGGDLDTVVDVRSNMEFDSLSSGINSTVSTLKDYIAEANTRIDNELRYAREIQRAALPSRFPAFPDRNEFDIFALMDPAKEVGGDFYDFYILDEDTLVFLVADVSGKGIPASLFMMRAKTALKTYAENNVAPADIFTNANYNLCEGNDAGMFVTAWMGLLNLKTGELTYVSAGHNDPLLKRKDGSYEFLKCRRGFVLGGMEGMTYRSETMMLSPGDAIFLYTDGVVEATDAEEKMYGNDRLKECLNRYADEDARMLCTYVREDVDRFYRGAEQFDDITELSLQFIRYSSRDTAAL